MYELDVKEKADKVFFKLAKKDPNKLRNINKKIYEIRLNPFHEYKFLKKPLQNFNRVHIDKNFVLVFRIDHFSKKVVLYNYEHHDKVYSWRPE